MAKDKSKKAAEPNDSKPKKSGGGDLVGPGSSGTFVTKEHVGDLLLITPTELVEGMQTSASREPTDAIRADIVVLNQKKPEKSETIDGALIFAKVVQGQLREPLAKGTRVVGTLIEDVASQKKGKSAPYRLTAPTDEDIQVARAYLDALDPLR